MVQHQQKTHISPHYAADGQEPNDHGERILQPLGIRPCFAIHTDLPQKLQTHVQIKDGTNANGAKKSHKQSLLLLFDLPYIRTLEGVQGVHDWETAKDEDENTKGNESIERYDIVVEKTIPWADRPKPNEYGEIE